MYLSLQHTSCQSLRGFGQTTSHLNLDLPFYSFQNKDSVPTLASASASAIISANLRDNVISQYMIKDIKMNKITPVCNLASYHFGKLCIQCQGFPTKHSQVVNSGAKQLQVICCISPSSSFSPLGLGYLICKAEGVSVCMCECVHTHLCSQIWRSCLEGPLED